MADSTRIRLHVRGRVINGIEKRRKFKNWALAWSYIQSLGGWRLWIGEEPAVNKATRAPLRFRYCRADTAGSRPLSRGPGPGTKWGALRVQLYRGLKIFIFQETLYTVHCTVQYTLRFLRPFDKQDILVCTIVCYTIDILKPKYNKYHVASQFGNGRTEMFLCVRLNIRLLVLLTFYFMYLFIYFISFYKKKINCLPCCSLPTWRRASWARTWLCRCRTASWTWVRGRGSGSVSTGTGPALERLVPRYGLLFQFSVMANSPYSALRPTLPVPHYGHRIIKWQNRKLPCIYRLHLKVALPRWRMS